MRGETTEKIPENIEIGLGVSKHYFLRQRLPFILIYFLFQRGGSGWVWVEVPKAECKLPPLTNPAVPCAMGVSP